MKFRLSRRWLVGTLIVGVLCVGLWRRQSSLSAPVPGVARQDKLTASPPLPSPPPLAMAAQRPAGRVNTAALSGVFSADWPKAKEPALANFAEWTGRYLGASPDERAKLLSTGVEWARQRRVVLAALIRTDPRAALAAAVPMVVRQQLPETVVSLLEDRVSGQGKISLKAVIPAADTADREIVMRTTLIGRTEYHAYVYGRRDVPATVTDTAMVGIAIDGAFAISESPLRVLEPGERAGARPVDPVDPISGTVTMTTADTPLNTAADTAVEYDGKINVLGRAAHVAVLEQRLLAAENDHLTKAADGSEPPSNAVTGRPTSAWTHGTKKVLIILVDFSDLPGAPVNTSGGAPITSAAAVSLFTAAGGVGAYYTSASYNQTALQISPVVSGQSPDVTPVLRLKPTAASYATAGNNDLLHSDAEAAAVTAGYAPANYDRVGVVFSTMGNIPGSQITYGGLGEVIGTDFWVNGEYDLRVVAHEIGHNYGLNHANLWQVTDGNPVSPNGSSTEYGDIFDVMGSGSTLQSEFTHWNKNVLGWIPDSDVTVATAPGTYRVYRLDGGASSNLANPRVLKIARDATRDYWIGYRQSSGNASLNGGAYILWGYHTNQKGNLLDMTTPGVNPGGVHDEGLAIGTTFNDTAAGISITPIDQSGSGSEQYLDVQVGFQSSVEWSLGTFVVDEQGGNAVLTLNRTQSSSGALSVTYTTANGTATAPANYTATSGTVSWADGDLSAKAVSIPLVAGSLSGLSATFSVTLSGVTGGVIGNSPSATVQMVAPGGIDPSFAADFINNYVQKALPEPDGSLIIGGWFDLLQDVSYDSYNLGGIARLTAAGTVDPTFATGGGATGGNLYGADYTVTFDLARQPDGKIIVVGEFTAFDGTPINRIARLNPDGSLDSTFNPGTGANGTIYAVLVQPDGRIIIGGAFTSYNGANVNYLARLNSDGSLDTGFNGPAFANPGAGWSVESLALQPDGKLLVGGVFYFSGSPFKAGICRVLTTGALDPAFNGVTSGAHDVSSTSLLKNVYCIVVQPDGNILIAGDFTAFNGTAHPFAGLARLTATGALDSTFAPPTTFTLPTAPTNSIPACNTVLLQPDGAILVGGNFAALGSNAAQNLARLSPTGTFDATFAAAGGFGAEVHDLELLPTGQVLLVGDFGAFTGGSGESPVGEFIPGLAGLPGVIQFGSALISSTAGGTAVLSVSRTGGSLGSQTVGYATVAGTATTATYTPTSGTLSWTGGDASTKTITVPLTAGAVTSGSVSFTVNLGQPVINSPLLGLTQQATVQITPALTGFAAWQQAKFTAAELTNPAISGATAIYGADGLPNLVKYALGLEPKQNITSGLPVATQSGGNWVFTYTRPTAITDVTYAVEVSTDLATWTPVSSTLQSSSGGIDTWVATYPVSATAKAFFHLKISQ